MSMKQRKMRQLKKAARRELIYQIVNSIPVPRGIKRILRSFLSTLSLNLLFATALACIVFWFVSGV